MTKEDGESVTLTSPLNATSLVTLDLLQPDFISSCVEVTR